MRISDWSSDVCSSDLLTSTMLEPRGSTAGAGRAYGTSRSMRSANWLNQHSPGCSHDTPQGSAPAGNHSSIRDDVSTAANPPPGVRMFVVWPWYSLAAKIGRAHV